jgi:hypothetical protein
MTNKHDLNLDFHDKTDGMIVSVDVFYDIDKDGVSVDIGIRDDVTSEELLHQCALQVEHALRDKALYYGLAMQALEAKAGLPATNACGCTKSEGHIHE